MIKTIYICDACGKQDEYGGFWTRLAFQMMTIEEPRWAIFCPECSTAVQFQGPRSTEWGIKWDGLNPVPRKDMLSD